MNSNLAVRNQYHVKSKTGPSSGERQAVESLSELQARLGASTNGLPQAEAQRRLAQYGYNEIPEEKTNPILRFLSYFWGPIPWMIEVAVILSKFNAKHFSDIDRLTMAGDRKWEKGMSW